MGNEREHLAKSDSASGPTPAAPAPASTPVASRPSWPRSAMVIQTKMTVGASNDPYEREADAVADSAMRLLSFGNRSRRSVATPPEHAHGPADSTMQRISRIATSVGPEGGPVDSDAERQINASRSGGKPLDGSIRRAMEHAIGADFGGVRVHVGAQSDELAHRIQAKAFTTGSDVFVRRTDYSPGTKAGQHLLAHELAHTVQQGASPLRTVVAERSDPGDRSSAVRRVDDAHARHHPTLQGEHERDHSVQRFQDAVGTITRPTSHVIQRHAAFEHYLLGQLQPREVAAIPAVRKIENNKEQAKRIKEDASSGTGLDALATKESPASAKTAVDTLTVKHLIEQEMSRLLAFKDNPEALEDKRSEMGEVEREEASAEPGQASVHGATKTHPKWKVPIVVLQCQDGSTVVTYSEVNTLPDFFGNPEAIAMTPKSKVLAILQGVRQQLYIELDNLQKEIFGKSTSKLSNTVMLDDDFKGAAGPRAQAVNDKAYEVRTESQLNAATTRDGEKEEQYFAALERNACHFAPESWNQWRGYHDRALQKAQAAAVCREEGDEQSAALFANEALLLNGFGEHYLQDSFASGHLIDKTKIMRWFTQWVEANGGHGSLSKGKGEWAMKLFAANQELQSNPQRLHDMAKRGEITTAEQGADEVGMEQSPAITFLVHWRTAAARDPSLKHLTPTLAAKVIDMDLDPGEPMNLLEELVEAKFAKRIEQGKIDKIRGKVAVIEYSLHEAHIEPATTGKGAYDARLGRDPEEAHSVGSQVAEFNLEAYNLFMSDAHLQGSTKYFHDTFCKEGLEVTTGTGVSLGRIYGDANMLNAGGQKGLEYAAETSRQSRSAVFHAINGMDAPYSTDAIAKRFPASVNVDGSAVPLAGWNDQLKQKGDSGLFKKASSFGARVVEKTGAAGGKSGISAMGALKLSLIKEIGDAQGHLGEGF